MDKTVAPCPPSRIGKEKRPMMRVLDVFYSNPVLYIAVVGVLGALSHYIGLTTVGAFLFMLLGMMIVLWDAHTDSHIPPAPTLT